MIFTYQSKLYINNTSVDKIIIIIQVVIEIIVPIEPQPKKRPRVYRWSTVNPSIEDEDILAWTVKKHENCPKQPLKGQIRVQLKFYKKPAKNTPQWKLPLMENGTIRPNMNPDVDNYVKLVLDSLNGIIWEDDRYIVEIHAAKYYSTNPRTEIFFDQIPEIKTKKDILKLDRPYTPLDSFF